MCFWYTFKLYCIVLGVLLLTFHYWQLAFNKLIILPFKAGNCEARAVNQSVTPNLIEDSQPTVLLFSRAVIGAGAKNALLPCCCALHQKTKVVIQYHKQ